jgi:hypothetical protein
MAKKQAKPRFSLRGVITIPKAPNQPAVLQACYPDDAERALEGVDGIILANPNKSGR